MEGLYDIFWEQEKIGKAEVCREGLYYRFRCCCDLRSGDICRISVTCGSQTENLGVPAPNGDCFYLQTRLPVSRFSKGEPSFRLTGKYPKQMGMWMPISEDMSLDPIVDLEPVIAQEREGKMGIFIPEEALRDSDLSPVSDCE